MHPELNAALVAPRNRKVPFTGVFRGSSQHPDPISLHIVSIPRAQALGPDRADDAYPDDAGKTRDEMLQQAAFAGIAGRLVFKIWTRFFDKDEKKDA